MTLNQCHSCGGARRYCGCGRTKVGENYMTIDSWLLRGKQEPDFEMRLAIYEELRAKRKEIERLRGAESSGGGEMNSELHQECDYEASLLADQNRQLQAENDRLRKVVDAALDWKSKLISIEDGHAPSLRYIDHAYDAMHNAMDEYQRESKPPASRT